METQTPSSRLIQVAVLAVLQLFINFIPSTILNSLILASYCHCKNLRSPYNLLFVCFSGLSLVSHIILFILSTIAHPVSVVTGTLYIYLYFEIKIQHFLVFSLPSLTITLIAVIQCYIILFGAKKLTNKRLFAVIAFVWGFGLFVWIISTTGFIYSRSQRYEFTDTNLNSSSEIDATGIIFVNLDGLFIDIPCFVVIIVVTITSCGCFFKRAHNLSASVQRRILLLPVLMISFFLITNVLSRSLVLLIPLFGRELVFLPILGIIIRLVSQSNSFLFAALFIGLQKKFREGIVNMLKNVKQKMSSCRAVRVLPVASVNKSAESVL